MKLCQSLLKLLTINWSHTWCLLGGRFNLECTISIHAQVLHGQDPHASLLPFDPFSPSIRHWAEREWKRLSVCPGGVQEPLHYKCLLWVPISGMGRIGTCSLLHWVKQRGENCLVQWTQLLPRDLRWKERWINSVNRDWSKHGIKLQLVSQ